MHALNKYLAVARFAEVNFLVRINPGSNVQGDNKTGTAVHGMTNVEIPEPKIVEKGKFECPVCGKIFNSRADYDSHAMALHQANPESVIEEPMETTADEQPPVSATETTTTSEATMTSCEPGEEGTTCTST